VRLELDTNRQSSHLNTCCDTSFPPQAFVTLYAQSPAPDTPAGATEGGSEGGFFSHARLPHCAPPAITRTCTPCPHVEDLVKGSPFENAWSAKRRKLEATTERVLFAARWRMSVSMMVKKATSERTENAPPFARLWRITGSPSRT
jgi:hypothetical protein